MPAGSDVLPAVVAAGVVDGSVVLPAAVAGGAWQPPGEAAVKADRRRVELPEA